MGLRAYPGKGLQNLLGMTVDLHFGENPADNPLFINNNGRALHAHKLLPVKALFLPNAVLFDRAFALITQKGKGNFILFDKRFSGA